MPHADHIVNPEMIKLARARLARGGVVKHAFQDAAALQGGGGGGGGAPPMDPSMMGMDPAMMGGGGGEPPPPPGGGGGDNSAILAKLDQLMQTMQAGGGAGGAGGAGAGQLKPKIDVNVEIMQLKHMMAKVIDAMGIPVSAQEMTATPEKLTQMAQQQQTGDPSGMGAGGAGGAGGSIPPIDPMQGSGVPGGAMKQGSAREIGRSYPSHPSLESNMNKAAAIARVLREGKR